jgi:hypothetical protein
MTSRLPGEIPGNLPTCHLRPPFVFKRNGGSVKAKRLYASYGVRRIVWDATDLAHAKAHQLNNEMDRTDSNHEASNDVS